jgi:hypothetical protein
MTETPAKKTSSTTHLKDLLLLFSIPIGIAILAAIVVYVPRLMANPKTDFMYITCTDYRCNEGYSVDSSGSIVREYPDQSKPSYGPNATIYYYDATTDATKVISFDEAEKYRLNSSSKSPDGYTLTHDSSSEGFLFWGDYDESWYLKNGAKKRKVELNPSGRYYATDIKFLGWVQE